MVNSINHPTHYAGEYECIEAMRQTQGDGAVMSFCICNAFKYLWRHRDKGQFEDIQKCVWYLNYFIKLHKEYEDA